MIMNESLSSNTALINKCPSYLGVHCQVLARSVHLSFSVYLCVCA